MAMFGGVLGCGALLAIGIGAGFGWHDSASRTPERRTPAAPKVKVQKPKVEEFSPPRRETNIKAQQPSADSNVNKEEHLILPKSKNERIGFQKRTTRSRERGAWRVSQKSSLYAANGRQSTERYPRLHSGWRSYWRPECKCPSARKSKLLCTAEHRDLVALLVYPLMPEMAMAQQPDHRDSPLAGADPAYCSCPAVSWK